MEELKPKRMIFDANGEWVCWDEVKKNFESLAKENEELKADVERLELGRETDEEVINQLEARVNELEKGMKFIQSLEPKYFLGKYIDKLLTH